MKRFIGVALCLFLITGCLIVANEVDDKNEARIVETVPIKYLTDEELSMLYTCKQDQRKEDSNIISMSQSDAWLLMKLGRSEAGNNGVEAQYLAMMVVINRLRDEQFPDTISDVIYQSNPIQFAVVSDGRLDATEPNNDSHLALAMVEQGIDYSEGAIWFEASTNSSESWHSKNRTFLYEKYGQRYYK